MGVVILTILKIIGIILLCILGLILLLAGVVLFVPVRYRLTARKEAEEELSDAHVTVRVTWLLHLLNVCFAYPDHAYVRIRLLFFTIFRSDRPKKEKKEKKKKRSETAYRTAQKEQKDPKELMKKTPEHQSRPDGQKVLDERSTTDGQKMPDSQNEPEGQKKQKESEEHRCPEKSQEQNRQSTQDQQKVPDTQNVPNDQEKLPFKERFLRIVCKVWEILKNIRYTIRKIYDKIMDIIRNIRYYTELLKSDLFKETFKKCSAELLKLLKSIAPRKVKGRLRIGMEDPATIGKILGYYGMLYPLIGDHIDIVPDFDQTVLEGNLLIKGKITLFKAIKTGIIVYFNKDLRKLIQLWKREGT